MEITEVKQNWPSDLMRIDLTLGNFCNYKCWYCWPGCNSGTHKWPDFELFTDNLCHLLDHYLNTTHKKRFDIHVMGGEITHWPKFFDLIKFFKDRYDCIFTLTTNASKSLEWWEKATPFLDYVIISSHHQFCDPYHVRDVADLLYEKNIIVTLSVLMDPTAWDTCIEHVEIYKKSRRCWSIRYLEVISNIITYTDQQRKTLGNLRARNASLFWFLRNNKSYRSSVKVIDSKGKKHRVGDQSIVLDRMNNFKGWQCNVGVDWVAVKFDGTVVGICGNMLYSDNIVYNIFEKDFKERFNPEIKTSICDRNECWCMFEANMPKKRIIPIHAS